jgi:L-aspartate oxidase
MLLPRWILIIQYYRSSYHLYLCCRHLWCLPYGHHIEASHAAPRILHYADHTGMIITKHITQVAARHPLITMQPQTLVTDILREDDICVGVATLNRATGQRNLEYASRGTVLASGGLAGIYEHSTNPPGFNALGSSVALATRAGVQTKDLEYVQFHPTSLYMPNEARFLLTEALRGEGAILRDATGRPFAQDFHPEGELAPRDIVARGVFEECQKSDNGSHNVFLDITHREADWLHARFPTIQNHLAQRGLDLATDQLPIIPAAHYTCGGVSTDMHGRTSLTGLYAAGEAARTGLHGGNRLASTSLLEGLVFGASVADFIGGSEQGKELTELLQSRLDSSPMVMQSNNRRFNAWSSSLEPIQIENAAHRAVQLLRHVRRVMWDHVGLIRTPSGLATALEALSDIQDEAMELHQLCPTLETAGVRDAACAGRAVAAASAVNPESAGAHYVVPDSEEYSDDEEEVAAR